jgi:iron complex transport system permease protein
MNVMPTTHAHTSSLATRHTAHLRLLALLVVLACLGLAVLGIGQVALSPAEVIAGLIGGPAQGREHHIVVALRLPRLLTGCLCGAAMGIAGLLMQTLFRNPLADPWSMGLTAGGQLGAAIVVVAGAVVGADWLSGLGALADASTVAGAMAGTAAVAAAMTALARRVSTVTLLVLGLMLGFLAQSLISVLLHFTNRTQGRIFASWNDGNLAGVTWTDLPALGGCILVGALLALAIAKPLSALLIGEQYAESMGVRVPRLRRLTLLATVLLAAPVTAYCGPLIFIGLIVPHIARALFGTTTVLGLLLPVAVVGALLAVAGDFIVHLPWDQHWLHLNAILALLGAPVVIALLLTSRHLEGEAG